MTFWHQTGVTLQQILDFLVIAQHGSVHAAARASGETQPALSKSLKRLEQSLGAPLFDRHSRSVRLNSLGREFLVHAKRLAAEAQRARESIAQSLGDRRGRVDFGLSVAASLMLAPGAIRRFRREFPEVGLSSRSGLYHSLAPLLRDGQLDFAICPLPPQPIESQLSSRTLMRSRMVLVARRGHPMADVTDLDELAASDFVVGGPAGLPGAGIYCAFEQAGLGPPRVTLRTDGLIDTVAMVVAGDCLALLPEAVLQTGLLRERLTPLRIRQALPVYSVALFVRAEIAPTPAATMLVAQFEREAHYQQTESRQIGSRQAGSDNGPGEDASIA